MKDTSDKHAIDHKREQSKQYKEINYDTKSYQIVFTGGQVTVSSGGIWNSYGDITLGWTSDTDYITANSYEVEDGFQVKIADGQSFLTDDATPVLVSGTVSDLSLISGKKLTPSGFTDNVDDTYTIHTATGWNVFCDCLADKTYNRFSGKTVKLGADISVSREANVFYGNFDGQGHTLNFTITTEDNNVDGIAPFYYIETKPSDINVVSPPAIRNLNVVVDITTGRRHASGLVGRSKSITIEGCTVSGTIRTTSESGAAGFIGGLEGETDVTISNCVSSITIINSKDDTKDSSNGGFVGIVGSKHTLHIEGCLFNGKLLTTNNKTRSCGGFVGDNYKGTVTVTNCLYAPAAPAAGETWENTRNSATFVRNDGNYGVSTITNSYYTQEFNDGTNQTGQGKQLRSIMAGENVSVEHAGVAKAYGVSGITAYKESDESDSFTAGLLYDEVLYAGKDDEVSLTLVNTLPTGYEFHSYATAPAGVTITGDANPYTLTMPNEDVWVKAMFKLLPISVSYIDENGKTKTVDAIDLSLFDGEEIPAGSVCSFSSEDIANTVPSIAGDVTIILPDDLEISAQGFYDNHTITFYGQEKGNGKFNVSDNVLGNVTVYGGNVTIGGDVYGTVTIHGGNVRIEGGIYYNDIYLSGTNLRCSFWAANIIYSSVFILNGQTFYDLNGNTYTGNIAGSSVEGRLLRPYDYRLTLYDGGDNSAAIAAANGLVYGVTISGRTLYTDEKWNTLCLPFDLTLDGSALGGAEARKLTKASISGTTLNLTFSDPVATLEAGVPYIIKWDESEYNINTPWLTDVTINKEPHDYDSNAETDPNYATDARVRFIGTYDQKAIDTEDQSILFLSAENTLYYPSGLNGGVTINPFRAYFKIGEDEAHNARQLTAFNFNFGDGDATGISASLVKSEEVKSEKFYSLDGRRLNGKPTARGIYINNGRKVVVK